MRNGLSSRIARNDMKRGDKLINKMKAWSKGQKPKLTIENPDKTARDQKMIRVNADLYWGEYKRWTDSQYT